MSLADSLRDWQPGTVEMSRRVDPWPAAAFAGLIGAPEPPLADGDPLPPMWHWFTLLEHPATAQIGPDGRYVYVVRSDQTVEVRPIKVTQTENNVSLIASGLKPGEQVITSGWFKLTPGAKVIVTGSGDGNASVAATAAAPQGSGAK